MVQNIENSLNLIAVVVKLLIHTNTTVSMTDMASQFPSLLLTGSLKQDLK